MRGHATETWSSKYARIASSVSLCVCITANELIAICLCKGIEYPYQIVNSADFHQKSHHIWVMPSYFIHSLKNITPIIAGKSTRSKHLRILCVCTSNFCHSFFQETKSIVAKSLRLSPLKKILSYLDRRITQSVYGISHYSSCIALPTTQEKCMRSVFCTRIFCLAEDLTFSFVCMTYAVEWYAARR